MINLDQLNWSTYIILITKLIEMKYYNYLNLLANRLNCLKNTILIFVWELEYYYLSLYLIKIILLIIIISKFIYNRY